MRGNRRRNKKRKQAGSALDELLDEDGKLGAATELAWKRVIAWQIERAMTNGRITKVEMARRMETSRAALDRLLDPTNPSVTLRTIDRAAAVLGRRLRVELVHTTAA